MTFLVKNWFLFIFAQNKKKMYNSSENPLKSLIYYWETLLK